jgi:transposase
VSKGAGPAQRLEIFTGAGRRRSWTAEQKAAIVAESLEDGALVSHVARRHGLTPQQNGSRTAGSSGRRSRTA